MPGPGFEAGPPFVGYQVYRDTRDATHVRIFEWALREDGQVFTRDWYERDEPGKWTPAGPPA
jgi:hypothetical protein